MSMPELVILISAIVCIAAAGILYFHHSNAVAAGVAVISFVFCLYGIGQRVSQDTGPNVSGWWKPNNDGGWWNPSQVEADAGGKTNETKTAEAPVVVRRQAEAAPDELAKQPPLSPPTQLNALAPSSPSVTVSGYTSRISADRYVEVSARLVNLNEFPVKNIVLKCGDKTFASFDVSATVDKIVPAKSELYVANVRMGPSKPPLPPATCSVAKFDRAD
jgi:hypothetical protein